MSDIEKLEIAELIQKGKAFDKKWNLYKIGSGMLTILWATLYLGSQIGDWREWRRRTDNDIIEIKTWKQNIQVTQNNYSYKNLVK